MNGVDSKVNFIITHLHSLQHPHPHGRGNYIVEWCGTRPDYTIFYFSVPFLFCFLIYLGHFSPNLQASVDCSLPQVNIYRDERGWGGKRRINTKTVRRLQRACGQWALINTNERLNQPCGLHSYQPTSCCLRSQEILNVLRHHSGNQECCIFLHSLVPN